MSDAPNITRPMQKLIFLILYPNSKDSITVPESGKIGINAQIIWPIFSRFPNLKITDGFRASTRLSEQVLFSIATAYNHCAGLRIHSPLPDLTEDFFQPTAETMAANGDKETWTVRKSEPSEPLITSTETEQASLAVQAITKIFSWLRDDRALALVVGYEPMAVLAAKSLGLTDFSSLGLTRFLIFTKEDGQLISVQPIDSWSKILGDFAETPPLI